MWGWRQRKTIDETSPDEPPQRLREALRKARVDQAERVGTVVDLQDAELGRAGGCWGHSCSGSLSAVPP